VPTNFANGVSESPGLEASRDPFDDRQGKGKLSCALPCGASECHPAPASRLVGFVCDQLWALNRGGTIHLANIAQEGLVELDAESLSARSSRFLPKLSSFGQTRKGRHRNLDASIGRESSATRVASISSMWRSLGEQVSKLAALHTASAPHPSCNVPERSPKSPKPKLRS
jgi:hypothetical protein